MMIVIEGMDNSGKTTLQRQLQSLLGGEGYITVSKKSPGPLPGEELVDWTHQELTEMKPGELVIYDRFPIISETVYGTELRNFNVFLSPRVPEETREKAKEAVDLFHRNGPLIIYCRPSKDTIIEFDQRDQMEGVKENASDLLTQYDDLIMEMASSKDPHDNSAWNIIFYDYELPGHLYQVLQWVLRNLERINFPKKELS